MAYELINDKRIYRILKIGKTADSNEASKIVVSPYKTYGSWVSDFYNTKGDIYRDLSDKLEELPLEGEYVKGDRSSTSKIREEYRAEAEERAKYAQSLIDKEAKSFIGVHSMIHPYALVKLYGASDANDNTKSLMIDSSLNRKWYETESSGVSAGKIQGYAKNPTTAAVIDWGNSDIRGRFPYSFQDFVFCKYWNKIQNNRMITLRRYPAPVNDSVEPASYDDKGNDLDTIFNPIATAVTYFGGESGNKLSELLKFTVGYNWKDANGDVWNIGAQQNEGFDIFNASGGKYLKNTIGSLAVGLGILEDISGDSSINLQAARGLPPDPYTNGPYENRIIGPVNVINSVKKRDRGLKFSQSGLTIKFKYVARPIANVNTKAIMLDLLANMMVMTSSEGTFFGGLHRYRNEKGTAVYPWKNQDALNKMYSGKLFGSGGAFMSMLNHTLDAGANFITSFGKNFISEMKQAAGDLITGLMAAIKGKSEDEKQEGKNQAKDAASSMSNTVAPLKATLERAVSARMLKNMQIPWLKDAHALLTGEPVGEWHLTIGNPLNPIAVIGNLIMTESTVEFSDELGPDDFPTEITITVKLEHGMGRDRSGTESMFNRGHGRIYVLSDAFKTSADYETQVDAYTGAKDGHLNLTRSRKGTIEGEAYNDVSTGWDLQGKTNAVVGSNINRVLSNSGTETKFAISKHVANLNQLMMSNNCTFNDGYYIAPWSMRYSL